MDFKGIGWVGGIYQKFETLCHEVDNIVNQDTVKYVENQAQSVGKSMKRLYSGVIHDILPPLKHDGQGVSFKKSDKIDANVDSKASIDEYHIETVRKLSEPTAVDLFEKQPGHASNEVCLSYYLSIPASVEEAESSIMSGQVSDVMKNTDSDVKTEENAVVESSASEVLELIANSKEEFFGVSLGNEFIDCNENFSCQVSVEVSRTMSVNDEDFQSTRKEGNNDRIAVDVEKKQLDCALGELCLVDQLGNPNSEDSLSGTEHITSEQVVDDLKDTKPEVNIGENATMEKPLAFEVSELISNAEKESFGVSLLSDFIDFNDEEPSWVEAEVSPATSVHDVIQPSESDVLGLISIVEEESCEGSLVHNVVNCYDKIPCVDRADVSSSTLVHGDHNARTSKNDFADDSECVSVASGGINSSKVICCEENMAEVAGGSSSGSILEELLPENSPENSPAKALLNHDHVDGARFVFHSFHSSSMLDPNLPNEKKLPEEVSVSYSYDQSMDSFGIIDDSTDDIGTSSMETIALCDEVKLEDSCVIVDSAALCAVSRIMRKHRSYKVSLSLS
ncbi:hypothetical protein COLO4_17605 [Corchorus olitorius]|uniref:Uncharacterized protein n=1 Tax=Corchorus olitorius TaxID=93759 RepID=A0A1R3JCC9_9ROSI|nr:hypothetical protein COLO4_17605 [Corchorus olitorius]